MGKKNVKETKNVGNLAISGMIYKFGERISAQLVSTIVSIVLARILLPEDYAIISIVMVLISVFNVFVTEGLGSSLIQKENPDQEDFSTIFWAGIGISIVLYIVLFVASPMLAMIFENGELIPILRVMGLRIPVAAINSVQQSYVSKKFLFKKFFWATLTGTTISGFVGIVMAYMGAGTWALVAQYLVSSIINTLVLLVIVEWRPSFFFSFDKFKALFGFGSKVLLNGLISTIYEEIRSLIIGLKYSTIDLAYYTKGQQFPSLLANNATISIRNVMFPVFSLYQGDVTELKRKLRLSIRMCMFVMCPMLIGLAVIAENFITVILTEKWLPSVPYVYVFCAFYMFKPIKGINQTCLKALGRSGLDLALGIIEKIIGIVLLLVSMEQGVMMIALSAVTTYGVSAFLEMCVNGKVLRYSIKEQVGDIFPALVLSILMAVPVYLVGFCKMNTILLLMLQIFIGAIVYVILASVFKLQAFQYIMEKIFRKK